MDDLKLPSTAPAVPGYEDDLVAWLNEQRNQIEDRIVESSSLRRELKGYMGSRYPRVAKRASLQTRPPPSTFPAACPYTVDQLLDQDFLP